MKLRNYAWIACLACALLACSSADDSDDADNPKTASATSADDDADNDEGAAGSASSDDEADSEQDAMEADDDLAMCVEKALPQSPNKDCATCTCENCADLFDLCANNDDPNFVSKCMAVLQCGTNNDCQGLGCFCGMTDQGVDLFSCTGGGPCADLIREAAGISGGDPAADLTLLMVAESMDDNQPLAVATQLGRCMVGEPGVAGFCNDECQ